MANHMTDPIATIIQRDRRPLRFAWMHAATLFVLGIAPPVVAGAPEPAPTEPAVSSHHDAQDSAAGTPAAKTAHGSDVFADDSLVAYYHRRYELARTLRSDVETQWDMNVCTAEGHEALTNMMLAMLAELRLLYADDPAFLSALDASQETWAHYAAAQHRLRFPDPGEPSGSSAMMVAGGQDSVQIWSRIKVLMEWYQGEDQSEGKSIDNGSVRPDYTLAEIRTRLRAEGILPLKPADIGDIPDVGEADWLEGIRQSIEERNRQYEHHEVQ